jgi:hypothetical protein
MGSGHTLFSSGAIPTTIINLLLETIPYPKGRTALRQMITNIENGSKRRRTNVNLKICCRARTVFLQQTYTSFPTQSIILKACRRILQQSDAFHCSRILIQTRSVAHRRIVYNRSHYHSCQKKNVPIRPPRGNCCKSQ